MAEDVDALAEEFARVRDQDWVPRMGVSPASTFKDDETLEFSML